MSKKILITILTFFLFYTNIPSQWVIVGGPFSRYLNALHSNNNTIYAGGYAGMRKSTNNGDSWITINSGLTNIFVWAITTHNSNLYAGTLNGVFRSTDDGATWTQRNSGVTSIYIYALHKRGPYLFAGAYGGGSYDGGVFRSTNNGDNWTSLFGNGLTNENCYALTTRDSVLFAGTLGGVFRSTNNGDTWTMVNNGIVDINIKCLTSIGNTVYAGSSTIGFGAVYVTTDDGNNWTETSNGIIVRDIRAFASSGNYLFAATGGGGIYMTSNNGANWNAVNTGLTRTGIYGLTIINNLLFAGSYDSGYVYRRPVSEMTPVVSQGSNIPENFSLYQNYPNPFNPSTNISFDIPVNAGGIDSKTNLTVYDALGREIGVLVNEKLSPGSYSVSWSAGNIPSGIYFYTLRTGSFINTRKMILIK